MGSRRVLLITLVLLFAGPPAAAAFDKTPYVKLRDDQVGYSLRYPRGWDVERRPVGATAFASAARCRSVRVVDFEPPPDSGGGTAGFILHSFVQVCAKPVADGSSLDEFMHTTYAGPLLAEFERVKVGGVGAYAARKTDRTTIFVQANGYRIQIYSAVAADDERRATRRGQVRRILRSFSLHRS